MKTLTQHLTGAALAVTLFALVRPVAADHVAVGGGVVFGGHSGHTSWQIGIGTGGVGVGVAVGGGGYVPAPVAVPRPAVVVRYPVVVRHPVVCQPVVVPAPIVCAPAVPVYRARVVHYVHACRRIAQPMVHGALAAVEVRAGVGQPWIVVEQHPSIW